MDICLYTNSKYSEFMKYLSCYETGFEYFHFPKNSLSLQQAISDLEEFIAASKCCKCCC
jgi:hypothetical protein